MNDWNKKEADIPIYLLSNQKGKSWRQKQKPTSILFISNLQILFCKKLSVCQKREYLFVPKEFRQKLTYVLFIPYFRLLVFGFWYFGHFSCKIFFPLFLPSCPSSLIKFKQRLGNTFKLLCQKVTEKPKTKNGMKEKLVPKFYFIIKNTYLIIYFFRSKWNYRTSDGTKKSLFTPTKSPTIRGVIHNLKTR